MGKLARILFYVCLIGICFAFSIFPSTFSHAAELLFEDHFENENNIDMDETSAIVDTLEGVIRLPSSSPAGGIDIAPDSNALLVVDGTGAVNYYELTDDEYLYKAEYSTPPLSRVIDVAFAGTEGNWYELSFDDENRGGTITYYGISETGAVNIPLQITGLLAPRAIAAWEEGVIVTDDGKNKWYRIDNNLGELIPLWEVPAENNVLRLRTVPGTWDVVEISNDGYRYLHSTGTTAIPLPALSHTGLTGIIAGDSRVSNADIVFIPLDQMGNTEWLELEDDASISALELLTTGPTVGANSVVLSQNEHETYLVIRNETSVIVKGRGAAGWIDIPPLYFDIEPHRNIYYGPRSALSKNITLSKAVTGIKYEIETVIPEGTSIELFFSNDGGLTEFQGDEDNIVRFDSSGEELTWRAVLDNIEDIEYTPLLFSISIYDQSLTLDNFRIINIVNPPPGNPELPTDQLVMVKAGYAVTFKVDTIGAEIVTATTSDGGSLFLFPDEPVEEFYNSWTGTYLVPATTDEGTLISLEIKAVSSIGDDVTLMLPNQIMVVGNIYGDVQINQIR